MVVVVEGGVVGMRHPCTCGSLPMMGSEGSSSDTILKITAASPPSGTSVRSWYAQMAPGRLVLQRRRVATKPAGGRGACRTACSHQMHLPHWSTRMHAHPSAATSAAETERGATPACARCTTTCARTPPLPTPVAATRSKPATPNPNPSRSYTAERRYISRGLLDRSTTYYYHYILLLLRLLLLLLRMLKLILLTGNSICYLFRRAASAQHSERADAEPLVIGERDGASETAGRGNCHFAFDGARRPRDTGVVSGLPE